MIIILGGSGYVGSAFRRLLDSRGIEYRSLSRSQVDYTHRDDLYHYLKPSSPSFLINCAGYVGLPNVDACELNKGACISGNVVLPCTVRMVCDDLDIPWGHVSSGCIYSGPSFYRFTEDDRPNFCFRSERSSFYSGSKALAEDCINDCDHVYIWRLRIPFNHVDHHRNYLSKLMTYDRLLDVANSLSHLDEFCAACLECWMQRIPFGTYNMTNTGYVTTREVASMINSRLSPSRSFSFFESEDQFMMSTAKTPRSSCALDNSKILSTGIRMSEVHDAIDRSLREWTL